MKLVIGRSTADDLNLKSNLFKMQTDQLSFERFEELFDREDEELPDEPEFDVDWRRCEEFFLHAGQSGVFVAVIDVMQLIDRMTHSIEFFISYDIRGHLTDAKMTMYAGKIDINAESLYGGESMVFHEKSEVYKDLLAVTSSSTEVLLTVKFEKMPKLNFQDFLKLTLEFVQLSADEEAAQESNIFTQMSMDFSKFNNTERMEIDDGARPRNAKESLFFYCPDNYFKGMLVRLKVIDPFKIEIKLYVSLNHQIVTFVNAIHGKYSEPCSITAKKAHESLYQNCNVNSGKS